MSDHNGTWWIWKVFWILLVITGVEVALGIVKPEFMLTPVIGTSILNIVFIVLTLIKAAYIVQIFMHVKFEKKGLKVPSRSAVVNLLYDGVPLDPCLSGQADLGHGSVPFSLHRPDSAGLIGSRQTCEQY